MALSEENVYAALGMNVPAKQPEAADPAGQGANEPSVTGAAGREDQATGNRQQATGDAGETDSSPAAQNDNGGTRDPATTGDGGQGSGRPTGDGDAGDGNADSSPAAQNDKDSKGTMSRAERAEQARLRREREQKAAVDAAVQAALQAEREKNKADMKAMFESAGMVDRYHDNRPITNLEEFQAFQAARQADKLSRELQGGKLTPESLQAAIDNSPAVKAAQKAVEALKAKDQAASEEARKAEFERRVADELAEIHRMDPSVNTIDDILAKDTGNEFARLVRENNLSFLQAYKLANADGIAEARARAAREGAARNAAGKSHLRSINTPGAGVMADVPAITMRIYRELHPDWTGEQIRQDYVKWMK